MRPHPFLPLTDPEFAFLSRHLPPHTGRRGRPPADPRRTLNAIFWVACSSGPWKDLPEDYGRPGTASRQLRRWARSGHMDLLLALVAGRAAEDEILNGLAWRICRAWRRISRVVPLSSLMRAKTFNLRAALPAPPNFLPDPNLSKAAQAFVIAALKTPRVHPPGTFNRLGRLLLDAGGRPRHWRLR